MSCECQSISEKNHLIPVTKWSEDTGLIFLIGEEVKEEVKDAVADEPEVEDVPQENDDEPSYDEDDEQLEDDDDAEESN